MNIIIHEDRAARTVLNFLEQRLNQLFGNPTSKTKWTFPNGGVADNLPTWSVPLAPNKYLIIGFKPKFRWKANNPNLRRCPFLLSTGSRKAQDGITPKVEINIPYPMRRTVNGCFAVDSATGFWLFHRGNRLTVQGNLKIDKTSIHQHFKKVLVPAWDKGRNSKFIPVVRLESDKKKFQSALTDFTESINDLKTTW